jgi:hypothetical protein
MIRKTVTLFAGVALLVGTMSAAASADPQYDDVPADHPFASDIAWLAGEGVTRGCNPPTNSQFCPSKPVTRGQMAAFMVRALGLTDSGGISFVDDDSSVFEEDIERMAAAGITAGCNPPVNDRFCPDKAVNRGQMAAFLVRGLNLSERSGERFVDDDSSVFEVDIERIATAGITTGCNPPANDRYCPETLVTRGQMAAFLHRALISGLDTTPDALPSSRRIDWEPGVPGGVPDLPVTVRVTDHGAKGNGSTDDWAAIEAAIDALPSSGGVVYFPAGTYVVKKTLQLGDGVVLRGAGSDATSLEFDLGGRNDPGIRIVEYDAGSWRGVAGGFQKGSNKLTLSSTSGISAPAYAEIQQTNDPAVMYTQSRWNVDWAEDSVGEMVRIVAVSGNTITLDKPLNISYRAELNPVIRTQDMVERAGVERLRIKRRDSGNSHTIYMTHVANSWVREVESDKTGRTHVTVSASYGCEIRDSYFHDAHDYGQPGRGYGINLDHHATGCLIENNNFDSLRHSMMVQVGANGNVFGYNYSRNSHDAVGTVMADISIHGHYAVMNLFEGNIVDEVGVGDWWGPAGPGNTLLRNCVQTEGLLLNDHSHNQNVIGNVLNGSPNTVKIDPSVDKSLVHGNYESGAVRWDPNITIKEIRRSYYLNSAPNFYVGTAWPSTGSDKGTSCTNPAKTRLETGHPVP